MYFNDANSLFISFHPASSATSDTHFWNVSFRLGDFSVVKKWNETYDVSVYTFKKKTFLSLTHLSQIYSCFLHLCDRNPNLGYKVSPITLHLLLQPPSEGPASSPHFVSTLCPTVQGVALKFWVLLKFSLLAQVATDMSPSVDCPLASSFPL